MSRRSDSADAEPLAEHDPGIRFTLGRYLVDNKGRVLLAAVCAFAVFATCFLQRVTFQGSVLASAVVVTFAVASMAFDYTRRRGFYRQLEDAVAGATDACVPASLLDEPEFIEGRAAYDAISSLTSAASRQISAAERDAEDYRRYIDAWVHEVKTPIAASKLVLAGMHGESSDKLSLEVERIESQVESALFYARSSFLAGDYAIGKVDLAAVCREACKHNSRFLIAAGCTPSVEVPEGTFVLSDRQWVAFILSQLLVNSAKYGAHRVTFSASVEEKGTPREHTTLQVADDGCGIPPSDVARVFEMGFVGENGRERGGATGLGLYLVARLCESMGVGVAIASEQGRGTRVMLEFPHDLRRLDSFRNVSRM